MARLRDAARPGFFDARANNFGAAPESVICGVFVRTQGPAYRQAIEAYGEFSGSDIAPEFLGLAEACDGRKLFEDKTSQAHKLSEVASAVNQMDQVPQQNSPRAGEAAPAKRSPVAAACKRR